MSEGGGKRSRDEPAAAAAAAAAESDSDSDEGPEIPSDFVAPSAEPPKKKKKRKVLPHEQLYLDALPLADMYEQSYMHREDITHVVVSKTDFVITASSDGVLMFWSKKLEGGIEFVKTFRSHLKPVVDMVGSADGQLLATASEDQTVKFYDIVNFDMFLMLKLDFTPGVCEWLHKVGSPTPTIAVADANGPLIRIYGTGGSNVPLHTIDLHSYGVTSIVRNPKFDVVISTDEKGMVEFWSANDYKYPKILKFTSKIKTDLYDFVKCQAVPWGVAFSPNGQLFAAMASDRKVRIFKVATGKLHKVYDESLEKLLEQSEKSAFDAMELGRRKAGEMELLRSGSLRHENCVFDESSNFVIYPTMVGIKVVNILTNVVSRIIGKGENMRCLQLTLYQGIPKKKDAAATTLLQETADNPGLRATDEDPTLFSTGFKKSRFYMFTRREPDESVTQDIGRDVFNLKPTREEQLAATGVLAQRKLAEQVTMHTSMGDVTIDLFLHECPKTVENFVTHCRDGYFNGIIFHRVIDRFMVQTGDPDGNGTGGESIWGTEFEDEFHPTLKHDRPYTVSMANGGPNTNGSQFFITLVPTAWLDNKHTVFGRVSKGMETVQSIGAAKVDKEDKPYEEIKIINVSVR